MFHTFKVVVQNIFLSLQALCIIVFVKVDVVLVIKVLCVDKLVVIERTFFDIKMLLNVGVLASNRCHEVLRIRLLLQLIQWYFLEKRLRLGNLRLTL